MFPDRLLTDPPLLPDGQSPVCSGREDGSHRKPRQHLSRPARKISDAEQVTHQLLKAARLAGHGESCPWWC